MRFSPRGLAAAAAAAAIPIGVLSAGTAFAAPAHLGAPDRPGAPAHPGAPAEGVSAQGAKGYTVATVLSGQQLSHTFTAAGAGKPVTEHLTLPDDITTLGGLLYTAFQNGVGPQGQASTDGNLDSTIVAFTRSGRAVHQWDVRGKCDGLTADPWTGTVIATVNEDANSSLYAIHPKARRGSQVQHYAYNEPLPHKGGTDAISVYRGRLLISASAPGTTGAAAPNASYPAVYTVSLDARTHVATVRSLFGDEAKATVANSGTSAGKTVSLALTDPDSNEIVPWAAPRFRGDFMLTSQGDQEQIYVRDAGTRRQSLSLLSLSQSVDDTAWAASGHGRLYATDNGRDTVDVVTGPFRPGTAFVAVTPCGSNSAPATCPAPPAFPANYLGTLNMSTGHISAVTTSGAALQPQGMIFVSP
jgi:hypothetical protein